MGAGVGLTMGFLFGSFSILRYVLRPSRVLSPSSFGSRGGAGPRGVLPTLSQYMLGSAATFSFFLAIGSVCGYSVSLTGRELRSYAAGHSQRWRAPSPPASGPHAACRARHEVKNGGIVEYETAMGFGEAAAIFTVRACCTHGISPPCHASDDVASSAALVVSSIPVLVVNGILHTFHGIKLHEAFGEK